MTVIRRYFVRGPIRPCLFNTILVRPYLSLVLIYMIEITSPAEPHTCYDHEFTSNQVRKVKSVGCAVVDEKPKTKTLKDQAANTNMFTINLKCLSQNADFCGKVKKSLGVTGETITKALMLKEPIVVDITFKPLSPGVIGQTGVSRFIPLKGSDGVDRVYPQGLVKQFELPSHPEFLPSDIVAEFSSELNFWFDDDTTPIANNQLSFSYMTLHEFMHGLGFLSLWDVNDPQTQTAVIPPLNAKALDASQDPPLIFNGFIDGIFDRFVRVMATGKTLSDLTAELNTFAPKGTQFASLTEFSANFSASTQFKVVTDMLTTATTPLTLGFLPKGLDFQTVTPNKTADDPFLYLETSLNPYMPGSSLSHASQALYLKSFEFLMTFQEPPAKTLAQAVIDGGNFAGGAIGPKLISVLESLGYATANNPNPEIPSLSDTPLSKRR
nr:3935_t:CDS:2 [Entrophospora candida]